MTARKAAAQFARTPAYVSRETGAAELGVSPATWDNWVRAGVLPAAAPGFPESTPRWRWIDVDKKLSGHNGEARQEAEPIDPSVIGAANFRSHGAAKAARRQAT